VAGCAVVLIHVYDHGPNNKLTYRYDESQEITSKLCAADATLHVSEDSRSELTAMSSEFEFSS
jgi:hypothetical protein